MKNKVNGEEYVEDEPDSDIIPEEEIPNPRGDPIIAP